MKLSSILDPFKVFTGRVFQHRTWPEQQLLRQLEEIRPTTFTTVRQIKRACSGALENANEKTNR